MTARTRTLWNDVGGAAAVELALIGSLLTAALMNATEVARYAWASAQVEGAAQAAAQAAVARCPMNSTPITTNCAVAASAMSAALQGASLGAAVKLHQAVSEGWYCVNGTRLQWMSAAASKPADCAGVGPAGASPALYIQVSAEYDYAGLFPGLTLTETFPDKIVRESWMRVR